MLGVALGLNCDSENSGRKAFFRGPARAGAPAPHENVSTAYPFYLRQGFSLTIAADFNHAS
jgi:hypothetical protein